MKLSKIALGVASLAIAASATDIFMPVPQGKMQGALGVGYVRATSAYDADGESQKGENGAYVSHTGIAARGAFGVIANLEANVEIPFSMVSVGDDDNSEDENGLNKPIIGVKYGLPDLGIAPFLDIALPFGGEDIVGEEPTFELEGGVIVDKMIGSIQARGGLSYTFIPEDKDKFNSGDVIALNLRPGFALNSNLIAEVDLNYFMIGESELDGETMDDSDASALIVGPGALFKISETMKVEATIPITVMGKNMYSFWGIEAAAYMQF